MLRPLHLAILALTAAIALPAAAAPEVSHVKVRFTGLHPATGFVMAGVYASQEAFDKHGAPLQGMRVAVTADTAEATIDLPAGHYAIKAFQDVDADSKMGMNPFGIPTEPYGFSNNAVGHMGPPAWSDAAFDVAPGADAVQTIALH